MSINRNVCSDEMGNIAPPQGVPHGGRRGSRVRNPTFGDQPSRAKSIQRPLRVWRKGVHAHGRPCAATFGPRRQDKIDVTHVRAIATTFGLGSTICEISVANFS